MSGTPTLPAVDPGATLSRTAIAALVPHAARMCLLDAVHGWSPETIDCSAAIAPDCPLLVDGRLPATALVEFAAQAMALHGGLRAGDAAGAAPTQGFLAAIRSVELACRWIAPADGPLTIAARRDSGDATQVRYDFAICDRARRRLAAGRAVVVLDAQARRVPGDAPRPAAAG